MERRLPPWPSVRDADPRGHLIARGGGGLWGNLDDRELVQTVMKVQRPLDEPKLTIPDVISADLYLVESDFAGFPPGEHVEEAVELSAVGGSQAVESVNDPHRR